MTSSLTELRPPPTLPPIPSLQASKRPSTVGYWVAAVVAVLGLMAAFLWGAVGISNTRDWVDGFGRTAVPGQVTVSVTDPGTMVAYHESAAEVAGYAEPTANARIGGATRWDPGTRTTVAVPPVGDPPTFQELGLQVTGPGGAAVPVATTGPASATTWSLGEPAGRWRRSRPRPPGRTGCRPPGPPRLGPRWPWVTTSPAAWC